MLSINEEIQRISFLSKKFNNKLTPRKKLTLEGDILGLHESVTKLWCTFINDGKNKDELGKRLANILIGTLIVVDRLKINNFDHHFKKRKGKLEKEINDIH